MTYILKLLTTGLLSMMLLVGCIGTDLNFDKIDPELRWDNCIEVLGVDDEFQLTALFFNNVGLQENVDLEWRSSNDRVAEVSGTGLIKGKSIGSATITATYSLDDLTLMVNKSIQIDEETIIIENTVKSGNIAATSNYLLQGSFTLTEENDGSLTLAFGADYQASTALPGLYVYLSNNTSSSANAYEIDRVTTFSGVHTYSIPSSIGINDFQYVLYFCKPFNARVGHGTIN